MAGTSACVMRIPPLYSTLRVNSLRVSAEDALQKIKEYLKTEDVFVHPVINDLIVVRGRFRKALAPNPLEVYVDRNAGGSLIRGSQLYASGILGSNRTFSADDMASVWMDLSGRVLYGWNQPFDGPKVFVGNGRLLRSRKDVFSAARPLRGIGVEMCESVFELVSTRELRSAFDWVKGVNFPSVVCAQVLESKPGQRVLDMCAAPGNKLSCIAINMKDTGVLIGLDVNRRRIESLKSNILSECLTCARVYRADASKVLHSNLPVGEERDEVPFAPQSFDRVLVDAPCSASGLRPNTDTEKESNQLDSFPVIQKKILRTAVQLVRPGGVLVYSTCSVRPEENEAIVRWLLDRNPDMKLDAQNPHVGLTAEGSDHLSSEEAALVQKFDPQRLCQMHKDCSCLTAQTDDTQLYGWTSDSMESMACEQDTIGFFIAKFIK